MYNLRISAINFYLPYHRRVLEVVVDTPPHTWLCIAKPGHLTTYSIATDILITSELKKLGEII